MNHAVARPTPTPSAVARSGMRAAMHDANASHLSGGSLEFESSSIVLAASVRERPRHR